MHILKALCTLDNCGPRARAYWACKSQDAARRCWDYAQDSIEDGDANGAVFWQQNSAMYAAVARYWLGIEKSP